MCDKIQIIKNIQTINIRYMYNLLKIKIIYRNRMYIYISIQILIKWRYIEYEDSIFLEEDFYLMMFRKTISL